VFLSRLTTFTSPPQWVPSDQLESSLEGTADLSKQKKTL
jgi:hypothetical protein